jgi:transcriptional regulator with XRE-family HTH domain
MSRSLKISPAKKQIAKSALRQRGFASQQALATKVGCGRDTVTGFFNGRAIDYEYFIQICEELNLEWQELIKERHIPHNLPTPTYTDFIGREEEKQRLLELLSPDHASNIITVHGIGGAGKTALVIAVAYQCLTAAKEDRQDAPQFDAIVYTSAKQQYLANSNLKCNRY